MDLYLFDEIQEIEIVPGFWAKFVHSENNTFALWRIEAGSSLPEHSHPHEQSGVVLEGKLEMVIAGEQLVLAPGKMVVIPGDVPHSGKALTDCVILDIFHPVREDYLAKQRE